VQPASARRHSDIRSRAAPDADRNLATQVRRARAAVSEAAVLRAKAIGAVAGAVATVSAVAARHGNRLRSHSTVPDAGTGFILRPQEPFSRVFTAAGVDAVRQLIKHVARNAGLLEPVLPDFVLAVQELMTNAVRHGGGWGRVRLYCDGRLLQCTVTDRGPGLTGALTEFGTLPAPDSEGGRGLYLARRMTDSLQISSGTAGVTVTVVVNLSRSQPAYRDKRPQR
jgi:anti-sigma regulatory factor (Ser/Thr protein kinase)